MTILEKANAILAEKEAKLLPENIKAGVVIFGVEGTYTGDETEPEDGGATGPSLDDGDAGSVGEE